MMNSFLKLTISSLFIFMALNLFAEEAKDESIKLLTSFEKEQMLKWGSKEKEGVLSSRSIGTVVKEDASEGSWALKRKYGAHGNTYYKSGKTRYNILRRKSIVNTYSWKKENLPMDWTGYDKLRVDFKSTSSIGLIRIEVEDSVCTPLLRREIKFPAGKWVTLEFDLKEASRIRSFKNPAGKEIKYRLLNLSKMTNFKIWPVQMDLKTELLVDNIRLVKGEAKEAKSLPILKDDRPFPEVEYLPKITPVKATPLAKVTSVPDEIKIQKLDFAKKGGYARIGFLTKRAFSSVSPNKMLLGFLYGYGHVLQTNDAGANWKGLDGKVKPTRIYHSANAPSHVASTAGADLLYVHGDYCAGGGNPSNMFFRLLKYENDTWSLKKPQLVDLSCRHCPEGKVQALRLSSGRIWVSWMHLSRFRKLYVRAKYSDDEGKTWQDPDSNALLKINQDNSQGPQQMGVTVWLEDKTQMIDPAKANGFIMTRQARGGMEIIPYGDHIASLSEVDWRDTIKFSLFDGESWSKPETITRGNIISAATLGKKDLYFCFGKKKKGTFLYHRVEDKWVDETPEWMKKSGRILLSANSKTLWAVYRLREGKTAKLYYSFKTNGSQWTEPKLIDTIELKTAKERLWMQIPAKAPENYLPVAWGPKYAYIKTCVIPLLSK